MAQTQGITGATLLVACLATGVAGAMAGSLVKGKCDTPTPTVTVSPLQTGRQDAPRGKGAASATCFYEDGNPDGNACVWTDPDTGAVMWVDSSEYRN